MAKSDGKETVPASAGSAEMKKEKSFLERLLGRDPKVPLPDPYEGKSLQALRLERRDAHMAGAAI